MKKLFKITLISILYTIYLYSSELNKSKVDFLKKEARRGNIKAEISLGMLYQYGKVVKKDYKKAIYWYKKASKKSPLGTFRLANMYELGLSVKQDINQAIKMYEKASAKGDIDSIFHLGELFYNSKKFTKSFKLFLKAAKLNDAESQFRVALMYEKAEGVEKDINSAINWYLKAAKQNFIDAQFNLASIYYRNSDYKHALFWYQEASKNGDTEAKYNVGLMYLKGIGVKRNKIISFNYLIDAAKGSHQKAQDTLDILCKNSPWACRN